jgi:uncharacterized membrane protein HdeD (DUF308 family)
MNPDGAGGRAAASVHEKRGNPMADSIPGTEETTGFRRIDFSAIREHRGWFFALGIGLMLLGAAAIFLPLAASVVTTVVLGWLMIVSGLFQGFHAIQNRRWGGAGWEIASAVLHVIAGILLVMYPITGTLTLTLVLAAFFAANGILKVVRAIQHRAMPRWGWLLFDGILSFVLGALIIAGWPTTAAWALGVIVGVDLLFSGSSMMMIAFAVGPSSYHPPRPAHAT